MESRLPFPSQDIDSAHLGWGPRSYICHSYPGSHPRTEVWDLLIKSNVFILWTLRMRKIRFTEVVWPTKVTQLDDGEIKLEPKTSDF